MFDKIINKIHAYAPANIEDFLENFEFKEFFGQPVVIAILVLGFILLFTKARKVVITLVYYSGVILFLLSLVSIFKDPTVTVGKAFIVLGGGLFTGLGYIVYRFIVKME